jgi:hypothetical protein
MAYSEVQSLSWKDCAKVELRQWLDKAGIKDYALPEESISQPWYSSYTYFTVRMQNGVQITGYARLGFTGKKIMDQKTQTERLGFACGVNFGRGELIDHRPISCGTTTIQNNQARIGYGMVSWKVTTTCEDVLVLKDQNKNFVYGLYSVLTYNHDHQIGWRANRMDSIGQ